MQTNDDVPQGAAVGLRAPELAVAGLLAAIAIAVIVDSLRIGVGWGDDGPRAGTFPFYLGVLLGLASVWIAAAELLRRGPPVVFAHTGQLRSVWAISWPMALFVAAIPWLGLYLSATLLIAGFMLRHGQHRRITVVSVSLAVPLVFYAVFERWFVVPLPKGALASLLGA